MTPIQARIAWDMGQMVFQARVEHGLSQLELAKRCRLHQETISRIESGKTLVTILTLLKIADGLETKIIPPRFAGMKEVISYRSYDHP